MRRRGSALLIVLGMISFLVVSAVAFSAFMRSARLPSSYLLRSSSSRLLVKAGLAEALDELDRAIGNNPHPGVGTDSGVDPNNPQRTLPNRNQWRERVFLGTNLLVDVGMTVSTLSLEGLAYVPAPLINDVRYYSRRSPAAVWHTLGYDSGRFAFTAVDVSDYFDVNRTMAAPENDAGNGGRTSADDARVSLAYLFENRTHSGWQVRPDAWDAFMDNFYAGSAGGGSKVPLVSWADLNLAIWDKKPSGVLSPWCRFVENGTPFVQDSPEERHALSNMVFVTDSLYVASDESKGAANLASGADQPFKPGFPIRNDSSQLNRGFDDVLQNVSTKSFKAKSSGTWTWADLLAPPEMAQLSDYLDADSIPCSLALPTVERAPMVTGVFLHAGDMHVDVSSGDQYQTTEVAAQDGSKTYYKVSTYTVRFIADDLKMVTGLAYPFKHPRGTTKSYKAQGFLSVAFVEGGADNLRPGTTGWATVPDWTGGSDQTVTAANFGDGQKRPSGFWVRSKPVNVNLPTQIEDEDDAALDDRDIDFGNVVQPLAVELPDATDGGQTIQGLRKDNCSFRFIQKYKRLPPEQGGAESPVGEPIRQFGMLPAKDDLGSALAENEIAVNKSYTPVIQAWVRVTEGEPSANKVVDLVPACAADDRVQSESLADATGSARRPALRFWDAAGNAKVTYDGKLLKVEGGQLELRPQAYMADDPRFNYAPENLIRLDTFTGDGANGFKTAWTTAAKQRAHGRDGDIFMACSDAGYLQSKYELLYLLRISGLNPTADWGCLSGGGYDGQSRTSAGATPADGAMWSTYTQYEVNGRSDAGRLDEFLITSGTRGARVCPYTPDTAVMMGALANTPVDWWAASTNDQDSAKQSMLSSIDTALRYTYSDHSSDVASKVKWKELEALARKFIDSFHNSSASGWRQAFDDMVWDVSDPEDAESFGDLCGTEFDTVRFHSVDRKYLFGFWRDCFALRQQLYLVFVRAEPMMMIGGGLDSQMPPMLGARAVALVWRSPEPTRNNAPHAMRVLFYRQFD